MSANTIASRRKWLVAALAVAIASGYACGLACLLAGGLGGLWVYRTVVGDSPGQGARAQRGYAACAPLIAAIAQYRQAHGRYPPDLAALVPAYLPAVTTSVNSYPIRYKQIGDSYSLDFSYVGPGMNVCVYNPNTHWHCYGYY